MELQTSEIEHEGKVQQWRNKVALQTANLPGIMFQCLRCLLVCRPTAVRLLNVRG